VPSNLSTATIKTQTESGTSFITTVGAGNPDGGFSVAGVPSGPYYFQYQSQYFTLTNANTLDLNAAIMGRINQQTAPSPTMLTINASGLSSWVTNNTISMTSTNLGMSVDSLGSLNSTLPTASATTATLTFDYGLGGTRGLIQSAAGDTVVLIQNQVFGTPVPYLSAQQSATVTGLTQTGGQSSAVNAVFTPLTQLNQNIDWRVPSFEAYLTDVSPTASVITSQAIIYGSTGYSTTTGVSGGTASLVYLPAGPGSPIVNGSITYGNPFPSNVALVGSFGTYFQVMTQVSGATATPYYALISRAGPLSLFNGAILPTISPPRNVQVNGLSATGPLSGVGVSPVITWTAPALGTPDRYLVNIFSLTNVGGATRQTFVGGIRTKGLRVRVPPGVMNTGTQYLVTIYSSLNNGIDVEARPFGQSGISDYAEVVLGMLTP
jgi:hypothetical protein